MAIEWRRSAILQLRRISSDDTGAYGSAFLEITTRALNLGRRGVRSAPPEAARFIERLPTGEHLYACPTEFCTLAIVAGAIDDIVVYVFAINEPFDRDKAVFSYRTS